MSEDDIFILSIVFYTLKFEFINETYKNNDHSLENTCQYLLTIVSPDYVGDINLIYNRELIYDENANEDANEEGE